MLQWLIDIQRDIYLTFADHIKAFAAGGSWAALAAFLPMGIVFGAVHAMTPGHSKSVLATYLAGSSSGMGRSLAVSLILSFVHVGTAVLIAVLSLPLVSVALGSVGRAPLLENLSRGTARPDRFVDVVAGSHARWTSARGRRRRGGRHHGRTDPLSVDAVRHDLRDQQRRTASGDRLRRHDDDRRGGDTLIRGDNRGSLPSTSDTTARDTTKAHWRFQSDDRGRRWHHSRGSGCARNLGAVKWRRKFSAGSLPEYSI